MTLNEIRSRYLAFFKERGHTVIPSSSLVPENDPTTLFTGSGMQPLLPYFLGQPHPEGKRLVDSQKCFRAQDIEEVGDNRHTTFFEMLGNWSLGDYFKKEQINWFWEFLTKELGLDPRRIYVTCYIGNPEAGIPKDTESASIWKEIFVRSGIEATEVEIGTEENGYVAGEQSGRIFYYADKNWWSRTGGPKNMPVGEPGGPDTEVFYLYPNVPHDEKWGKRCHPNCDCGRYIELGNSVFMEYIKTSGGFDTLPGKNVDYGGGLERITAAVNDLSDVFLIDVFDAARAELEKLSGKRYDESPEITRRFRIVLDHARAAIFMMGDGVHPSNTERGYILRRLMRRAIFETNELGIKDMVSADVQFTPVYKEAYPELYARREAIQQEFNAEDERFRKTLAQGERELDKMGKNIDAFTLFTTYGFPIELTAEIARERGIEIDLQAVREKMKGHQALSRAGAAQKFAGGLADTAEKTVRLHTAHHLLLKALQIVLGTEVKQRGSNITQERLRIDFSYPSKMTPEQIAEVERIVNEKITENLPVIRSEMSRDDAEKLRAEHEFGQKYPERVSVYSVGPRDATEANPQFGKQFSLEFCGGPHASHTGELGSGGKHFKIQKEEAVSQGVRRIRAVLTNE